MQSSHRRSWNVGKTLGAGAAALFQNMDTLLADTSDEHISEPSTEVDPALLKPNPFQPRRTFNEESLQELADSIKEHGIIQPIIVEKKGTDFFIIAGERRTRAAIIAGLTRVPVVFRQFDDNKKLEIALIENIQRENLNPIEEAKAYREIMQLSNLNQDETAKRVGKSRSAVTNALRLLQLPEEIRTALENSSLSAGHARALLSLVNPADQQLLFTRIMEQSLSVREAEMQAAQLKKGIRTAVQPQTAPNRNKKSAEPEDEFALRDIEQQFIDALGTKVEIKGDCKRGFIQISYFSRADLDSLYEKLSAK